MTSMLIGMCGVGAFLMIIGLVGRAVMVIGRTSALQWRDVWPDRPLVAPWWLMARLLGVGMVALVVALPALALTLLA